MNHSDQPKTSLFVGDLSSYCSEEDLHQAFALYGVVKHVRVQRTKDKRSGHKTTAGYGFVKMWTADQASAAMSALDGTVIAGRKVRIRYATYHAEDTVKNESRVSLYLKFVATTPASNTNEDRIRQIYSQFGEVEDVTIRKQFVNSVGSIISPHFCGCVISLLFLSFDASGCSDTQLRGDMHSYIMPIPWMVWRPH